jgi:hypothetical protein
VEPGGTVRSFHDRFLFVDQSRGSVKLNVNNYFVVPHAKGDVWQGQSAFATARIGRALRTQFNGAQTGSSYEPATYTDHKYLAFEFSDSTHGGAIRYGWAEILLTNGNLDTTTGPNVTIYGYAYDDTGAFIAAGAVPRAFIRGLPGLGGTDSGRERLARMAAQRDPDARAVMGPGRGSFSQAAT